MGFKAAGGAGAASENAGREARATRLGAARLSTPVRAGPSSFPHRGELGLIVKNATVSKC